MIAAEHIDAMQEIIDASRAYVPYLTLLKGISIAEQYYPEPHLRPMRTGSTWPRAWASSPIRITAWMRMS